jgi:hypothetical protein
MKVEAAVLKKTGEPLVFEELELRKPLAGEVLVKIRASGICHTDLSVQNGALPFPLPVVLGHEGILMVYSLILLQSFFILSNLLLCRSGGSGGVRRGSDLTGCGRPRDHQQHP